MSFRFVYQTADSPSLDSEEIKSAARYINLYGLVPKSYSILHAVPVLFNPTQYFMLYLYS